MHTLWEGFLVINFYSFRWCVNGGSCMYSIPILVWLYACIHCKMCTCKYMYIQGSSTCIHVHVHVYVTCIHNTGCACADWLELASYSLYATIIIIIMVHASVDNIGFQCIHTQKLYLNGQSLSSCTYIQIQNDFPKGCMATVHSCTCSWAISYCIMYTGPIKASFSDPAISQLLSLVPRPLSAFSRRGGSLETRLHTCMI